MTNIKIWELNIIILKFSYDKESPKRERKSESGARRHAPILHCREQSPFFPPTFFFSLFST